MSDVVSYKFSDRVDGLYNVFLSNDRFNLHVVKYDDQVAEGHPCLNSVDVTLVEEDREGLITFFEEAVALLKNGKKKDEC